MKQKNIIETFYQNVEKYPDKTALIFENKSFSYLKLSQQVATVSSYLSQSGIKKGDKVGVLLPNCPEFVVLILVAANLGITLVPQNMTLSAKSIIKTFDATDVKHIFVWYSLILELKKQKNDFLLWMSVGGLCEDAINYDDILNDKKLLNLSTYDISIDEPYILTMTSGSTGEPKPITLLQSTKLFRAKSIITSYDIVYNDTILATTPLYHSLAQRVVLIPLLVGATSLLMAGFTPKEWIEKVIKFNVTFSMVVSSQLKQIYDEMINKEYKINSLRCLVSSSELLRSSLKKELIKKFDCDFYECYGTSEVACVTNISAKEIDKDLSVGRSLPEVDIKILKDDNTLALSGEIGEIICKTPMIFAGYYNRLDLTKKSMWNDYFCTGDLGKLDDDGYLYFQGRKKDIIVTGGINVYPKDIEDILNMHPKIIESSVISLLDDRLGEKVVAIIVANDNSLSIRELQRLCAKELADFQQPRRFILTDKLPKNSMGKVQKHKLVAIYSDHIGEKNV